MSLRNRADQMEKKLSDTALAGVDQLVGVLSLYTRGSLVLCLVGAHT